MRDKDPPHHGATLHSPLLCMKILEMVQAQGGGGLVYSGGNRDGGRGIGSVYTWSNWMKLNLENNVVSAVLEPRGGVWERERPVLPGDDTGTQL